MNIHDATEVAYKNGYKDGLRAAGCEDERLEKDKLTEVVYYLLDELEEEHMGLRATVVKDVEKKFGIKL